MSCSPVRADAQPRQLANALSVAPKLMASSMPLPTYDLESSPSGALDVENASIPAASTPNPRDCANITIV